MKKFTVEQYAEAKVVGKELGINFVGKTKETFIRLVNEALAAKEAAKAPKKPAARTLEDYGVTEGEVVVINGRPLNFESKIVLTGRKLQVTKASKVDGYIKGHLISEKNGQLQKCEIAIPAECFSKLEDEEVVA